MLFAGSLLYACRIAFQMIFTSEFTHSIKAEGVILQEGKVYVLSTQERISLGSDTILLPVSNLKLPDSLGFLYFDKEWKLKVGRNTLPGHEFEHIGNQPFSAWCCTQGAEIKHFETGKILDESQLIKPGIKWNHHFGLPVDRIKINLKKENGKTYLTGNFAFLNTSYSIRNKTEDVFELDFCSRMDSTDFGKEIFSFPFLDSNQQPSRYYLRFRGSALSILDEDKKELEQFVKLPEQIAVNNVLFSISKAISNVSVVLIFVYMLMLVFFSVRLLWQLKISNEKLEPLNLISQQNKYFIGIRIVLNCILLLGVPLFLFRIRIDMENSKILGVLLATLALNLSFLEFWLYLNIKFPRLCKCFMRIPGRGAVFFKRNRIVSIGCLIFFAVVYIASLVFIMKKANYEKFYIFPVIHLARILLLLIPVFFHFLYQIKPSVRKWPFFYQFICVGVAIILAGKTNDVATGLFVVLSFALYYVVGSKRKRVRLFMGGAFIVGILIFIVFSEKFNDYGGENGDKLYRITALYHLPDYEGVVDVGLQNRETVAQQLYILKAVFQSMSVFPNIDQSIIPVWRTTFFSDYGLLWSLKLGGLFFLFLFTSAAVFLVYFAFFLLISVLRPYKLISGGGVFYPLLQERILSFFLSFLIVQYVYTFLANLWVLPLTGQCPGVLSPSLMEILFHALFINLFALFLRKREISSVESKVSFFYIDEWQQVKKGFYFLISVLFQRKREISNKESKGSFFFYINEWRRVRKLFYFLLAMIALIASIQLWRVVCLEDSIVVNPKSNREGSGELGIHDTMDLKKKAIDAILNKDIATYRVCLELFRKRSNDIERGKPFSVNKIMSASMLDSIRPIKVEKGIYLKKKLNGNVVTVIDDPYLSGFPPGKVEPGNVDIQRFLNQMLSQWASRIDSFSGNWNLKSASVLLVKNNGQMVAGGSYPFVYNISDYHEFYLKSKGANSNSTGRDGWGSYFNYADLDFAPASTIKPLLAFAYLKAKQGNPEPGYERLLGEHLGISNATLAEKHLRELLGGDYQRLNNIFSDDLALNYYRPSDSVRIMEARRNKKELKDWATGLKNVVRFRDLVQAYLRIKQNRKIEIHYGKQGGEGSTEVLLSDTLKLALLHRAMRQSLELKEGTAIEVGDALSADSIPIGGFLCKTGTSGLGKGQENSDSYIILVMKGYTIAIHLKGVLPSIGSRLMASNLLAKIVRRPIMRRYCTGDGAED